MYFAGPLFVSFSALIFQPSPLSSSLLSSPLLGSSPKTKSQPQVNDLVSMLNQMTLTSETEVVVCPPSLYSHKVKSELRSDVSVGVQDVWMKVGNLVFWSVGCFELAGRSPVLPARLIINRFRFSSLPTPPKTPLTTQ